jgi:hypothetical protein
MNLNLEIAEVNFVLQVLGQLPTSSNVYPLLKKIEAQAIEQSPKEEDGLPSSV